MGESVGEEIVKKLTKNFFQKTIDFLIIIVYNIITLKKGIDKQ